MSKIKLDLPLGEIAVTGKQVTFVAPCDCSATECIQIDGVDYTVVDSMGNVVTGGNGGFWRSGAKVSVILDVDDEKAYLLNSPAYPISLERIRDICGSTVTLAAGAAWYKSTASKATITKVSIVSDYAPTGEEDEVWNADEANTGAIKCYRIGTEITMAPTAPARIRMNADSQRLFENFESLLTISGLDRLDSSDVTTLYHAFLYCGKLKRIYAPSWRLEKCENTNAFAPMAYQLEEIDIGGGLPTVGQQFAYLCTNLRKVSGVGAATGVLPQAFHACYRLANIDLQPEKITSIGKCAFFLTPVEDTVDLSVAPIEITKIGDWATRAKRWDASQLAAFKSMSYPDNILIDVPYPDSQNRYPDTQYTSSYKVAAGACNSLAMYHAWNAHYAGTDKVFTNWKDWWDTYYNANGDYASKTSGAPSASVLATALGWSVTTQYANTANNFPAMLNSLKNGNPVYINREVSGSGANHASLVVGIQDGKLLILDSAGRDEPVEPVTYALRIEDVFIQSGSDNDDTYAVINFG